VGGWRAGDELPEDGGKGEVIGKEVDGGSGLFSGSRDFSRRVIFIEKSWGNVIDADWLKDD
jgi:hypothetical protein